MRPGRRAQGYPPALPEDLAETVSLIEGEGRKIVADRVDVRDAAGQQRVVTEAVEQFGRLDIVVGLTNSLAVELGEFGIRVNSVHPYDTDTPSFLPASRRVHLQFRGEMGVYASARVRDGTVL